MAISKRLPDGTLVEGHRIERCLGAGSMGVVYLVTELATGNEVVLKLMSTELFNDEKMLHRFEREARLGAELHSPHIVRTLTAGRTAEGQPYLVMEYAPGVSVTQYVQDRGQLEVNVATQLSRHLLTAVASAHEAGVVHRDLKPDNMMVVDGPSGPVLKVLDFGIAKSMLSTTAQQTREGLGTPLWTAPEQGAIGYTPSPGNDVWAIGLIVFFLYTGKYYWRSIHESKSAVDLALELLRGDLDAGSVRAEQLGVAGAFPSALDEWFQGCLVRELGRRYVDAEQARLGFEAALVGMPSGPTAAAQPPEPAAEPTPAAPVTNHMSADRPRPARVAAPLVILLLLMSAGLAGYAIYLLIKAAA